MPASRPVHVLDLAEARRVALAAQGLHRARPAAVGVRRAGLEAERLGLLQVDSVNVLARAHLMPLFSRLGPYPVRALTTAAERAPRRLVETWGHEASLVVPEIYRLLGWRRRAYRDHAWGMVRSVPLQHAPVVEDVLGLLRDEGAATAREVHAALGHEHVRDPADWGWSWSVAKRVLEFCFFTGQVAVARRTASFERVYDLTERVLPPEATAGPEPAEADAMRALMAIAARAHGIGTVRCLADHLRLRGPLVRRAAAELVEAGDLLPVRVVGWDRPVLMHRDAVVPPRDARRSALVNPFDPAVFERRRLEELHGMRYRIEIYVPRERRVHGYYVLPFLHRGRFVARVDLRADRPSRVLQVRGAFAEPDAPASTAPALGEELSLLAGWLGLEAVRVDDDARGDLARALRPVEAG